MKRFVLFFFIVTCCLISSNAATVTWTGLAGNNNWFTPGNWDTNMRPGTNDDVVFNISAIAIMDDVFNSMNTRIINSLTITGGANVEIRYTPNPGFSKALQVKSTSISTLGLRIDAGCVLLFHGINPGGGILTFTLDMCGAAGVTGEISGELHFSGVGSTDTRDSTRLRVYNGGSYGNLVVKSGGVIKYLDLSGNTASAAGSYLTMENGSTYEIAKSYGYFPQASWQPNSLLKVSSPGTTVPGFIGGVTYGNLEWNCPLQLNSDLNADVTFNNVTFVSTNGQAFRVTGTSLGNYTMTINGSLELQSGSYLDILGADAPSGSSGKIILKGDLTNQFGGVLITNGNAGTTSKLELQGTINQNILMNGTFSGVRMEFIMNGDSATLLSPVTLPGDNNAAGANLQLVNGKIITTSANYIRLNDNATVSGGSSNSFVSGPMRKLGNDDFIFPVGKGSIYAPIGIYNVPGGGELVNDMFVAEYVRSNPQSTVPYSAAHAVSLDHVSFVEYWTLRQTTGSAFKKVSLTVNTTSFCKDLSRTYVSQWTSLWTNEPTTITNGPITVGLNQTGTIKSNNISGATLIAVNSAFTLATDLPFASNPLPIDLISFDASKLSNTKASVNWELATICSPSAKFEVQRADANKNFSSIGIVNASATDRFYTYPDNDLKKGINYYRLKMIDENGKISYSRTVAIMNGINGLMLTSLIPTVVNNSAMLTIASSGRQQLDLVIVDMQGRVVQKQNHTVVAGNTTIQLTTDRLSAGIYQLIGITSEGKTNIIRFVKQ